MDRTDYLLWSGFHSSHGSGQPGILTVQELWAYGLAPFLWQLCATQFPHRKILMRNVYRFGGMALFFQEIRL